MGCFFPKLKPGNDTFDSSKTAPPGGGSAIVPSSIGGGRALGQTTDRSRVPIQSTNDGDAGPSSRSSSRCGGPSQSSNGRGLANHGNIDGGGEPSDNSDGGAGPSKSTTERGEDHEQLGVAKCYVCFKQIGNHTKMAVMEPCGDVKTCITCGLDLHDQCLEKPMLCSFGGVQMSGIALRFIPAT